MYYMNLKRYALLLQKFLSKIKKITDFKTNSIEEYYLEEGHPHDLILIAYSLYQFSYLSRCAGIFGDENKFKNESDRIALLFKDFIDAYESAGRGNAGVFFLLFIICRFSLQAEYYS